MTCHFKAYDGMLCVECSTVFERGATACPSCTCTSLIPLSTIVKPTADRMEVNLVRTIRDCSDHCEERP